MNATMASAKIPHASHAVPRMKNRMLTHVSSDEKTFSGFWGSMRILQGPTYGFYPGRFEASIGEEVYSCPL